MPNIGPNEMGSYLTWQPGNNDDQITTQLVAKLQKAACASRATSGCAHASDVSA